MFNFMKYTLMAFVLVALLSGAADSGLQLFDVVFLGAIFCFFFADKITLRSRYK